MLIVAKVKPEICHKLSPEQEKLFGIEKLNIPKSTIPAVTHIDYSARIQTISRETNPLFYQLISKFYQKTNCPVVINTSFNVRGEPIVCSVQNSYCCFMRTEMDILVVENFVLFKENQPQFKNDENWQKIYELD